MSFLKAFVAAWVWIVICAYLMAKGVEISNDMQVLTTAIIIAGTLAGGEK